jgi:hypothetical protein
VNYSDSKNWHEAANAFALLPEDSEEFAALVEDIKKYGLNNPITLYQGKVLDGRNRARACERAGITNIETQEWNPKKGQTPEVFSASQNIYRRHLSTSQKKVGEDLLRGHTLFKNLRAEYSEFEQEYKNGWEKVKNGQQSLASFVRHLEWLKGGKKEESATFTVAGAAQAFLRLIPFDIVFKIYEKRKTKLREEKLKNFIEAWHIIRGEIYGITSDI